MHDQSFCRKTLERVLRKHEFRNVSVASYDTFREAILTGAVTSAATCFNEPNNPLRNFKLRGKLVYCLVDPQDELVLRQVVRNVKRCMPRIVEGRSQIVTNLSLMLAEGVPYRVYRLDIRSFYESFQRQEVLSNLHDLIKLSPQSKKLIETLLDSHVAMGGTGVPRGLSLSAVLSDLLMKHFDHLIRSGDDTFYYSRYVDDIIIVTSSRERKTEFLTWVKNSLPSGLILNPNKRNIVEALSKVEKINASSAPAIFSFDYLGYQFSVSNPTKSEAGSKKNGELDRIVSIDIASKKIKKIKTRIVRAFLDFGRTGNWQLLRDRVAYLTQNFSVYNPKAGGKKLAGIYHSYPLVNTESGALLELDCFLRNAVLTRNERAFSRSALLLRGKQKRHLLRYSFARGHTNQSFIHFSGLRISEIQRCWEN
ncbi:antiviral reverse transcriptase Drt3a [Limnobacter sp.]|uniref:antiviral reverse transcriptase Drt3a n=1 Tax=Limnobacter sp. TaxID=2003368 RepID=UPI0025BA6E5B|nr:antiviral reverse transcriptase Drt3a [Limnobacter sp.]